MKFNTLESVSYLAFITVLTVSNEIIESIFSLFQLLIAHLERPLSRKFGKIEIGEDFLKFIIQCQKFTVSSFGDFFASDINHIYLKSWELMECLAHFTTHLTTWAWVTFIVDLSQRLGWNFPWNFGGSSSIRGPQSICSFSTTLISLS